MQEKEAWQLQRALEFYNQGVSSQKTGLHQQAAEEYERSLEFEPPDDFRIAIYQNLALAIWLGNGFDRRGGADISDQEYQLVKRALALYEQIIMIYEKGVRKDRWKGLSEIYDRAINNLKAFYRYGIYKRNPDGSLAERNRAYSLPEGLWLTCVLVEDGSIVKRNYAMSQVGKQEFATSLRSSPKETGTEEEKGFLAAASEAFADVVKKSTSAAAELWDKYGDIVTSRVLQVVDDIAKHGRPYIMADEKYKTLVDYSWKRLPLPIRLLGRERLGWDALLLGLRDKIFLIEGEDVRVHPNAKEQIAAAFRSVLWHQASSDTHPKDRANTEVTARPQEVKAPTTPAAGKGTHPKVREILFHVDKEYFKHFEEMEENLFSVTTQLTELFEHQTCFRFDICDDVLRFEIKHFLGFLDERSTFDDLLNILQENDHSIGTTSCYVCLHPPHSSNGVSYVSLQNNHSFLMKWESADIAAMINLQFFDLKNSGYFLFKYDPPIAPAIRMWGPDNPRSTDAKASANNDKTILKQVADTSEGIGVQPHAVEAPSTQESASKVNTAPGQMDSSPDAGNNTVRCTNAVCGKELPADSVFCGHCGTKVVVS